MRRVERTPSIIATINEESNEYTNLISENSDNTHEEEESFVSGDGDDEVDENISQRPGNRSNDLTDDSTSLNGSVSPIITLISNSDDSTSTSQNLIQDSPGESNSNRLTDTDNQQSSNSSFFGLLFNFEEETINHTVANNQTTIHPKQERVEMGEIGASLGPATRDNQNRQQNNIFQQQSYQTSFPNNNNSQRPPTRRQHNLIPEISHSDQQRDFVHEFANFSSTTAPPVNTFDHSSNVINFN